MLDMVFNVSKKEFLDRKGVEGYYATSTYYGRGQIHHLSAKGRVPFILGKKMLDAVPDNEIDHERRYSTPELCAPERATTTRRVEGIELIINVPLTTDEIREVMHGYNVAQKKFRKAEEEQEKKDRKRKKTQSS